MVESKKTVVQGKARRKIRLVKIHQKNKILRLLSWEKGTSVENSDAVPPGPLV